MSEDVFDGDEEELRFSRTYDRKKVYAASRDTHGHGDSVYFKQPTYVHDLVLSIVKREDTPWATPAAFYRDASVHRLHDLTEGDIVISSEMAMIRKKIEIDQRMGKRKAADELIDGISNFLVSSVPATARKAAEDMIKDIDGYIDKDDPDLIAQRRHLEAILQQYQYVY